MKFAYADPPYLGCGKLYGHLEWDEVETHQYLIDRLYREFPDGWALSLSTPSLWHLLHRCDPEVRVGAWVKPFASFKPGVNPAYAWEPVIFRGGRKRDREQPTTRDWHSAVIELQKGLPGAKPESFCAWILELLGYEQGDELVDLYPGSGVMGRVLGQGRLGL